MYEHSIELHRHTKILSNWIWLHFAVNVEPVVGAGYATKMLYDTRQIIMKISYLNDTQWLAVRT